MSGLEESYKISHYYTKYKILSWDRVLGQAKMLVDFFPILSNSTEFGNVRIVKHKTPKLSLLG